MISDAGFLRIVVKSVAYPVRLFKIFIPIMLRAIAQTYVVVWKQSNM